MQAADLGHAIERLTQAVAEGPGEHPAGREAVLATLAMLSRGAKGYAAEKLAAVRSDFEAWLSDRTWEPAARESFQRNLTHDIEHLKKALSRRSEGQD